MELIIIFAAIVAAVIFVILITVSVQKRSEMLEGRYRAAANIIKEDLLNYSIRNPMTHNDHEPSGARLMVCLQPMHTKEKAPYVFDPARVIYIGRKISVEKNMICLNDIQVSMEHCMIYTDGSRIYIKDMNSSNGSVVKRGFQRYYLAGGNAMELMNRDKIYIGKTVIKVFIFYYDLLNDSAM